MWGISSPCDTVYPRVCGGSPCWPPPLPTIRGLSPRVRGKRKRAALVDGLRGSIPACAGEALWRG